MLSGETATGKYPVEAVGMMDRIIRTTEENLNEDIVAISHPETIAKVCKAGLYLAMNSRAKVMVTISTRGTTPRILSTFRGSLPVVVACLNTEVYRRSSLYYSVKPTLIKAVKNPELVFRQLEAELVEAGLVGLGDVIIFTFGHPVHTRHGTNSIRRWVVEKRAGKPKPRLKAKPRLKPKRS
jgi:pyruvate kinase